VIPFQAWLLFLFCALVLEAPLLGAFLLCFLAFFASADGQ
jgi:hypothetical protein